MPSLEINTNLNGGSGNQSTTPTPPPIGTLIDDGTDAGALQLTTVLGYGGYGVVYRAVAPSGGLYAVKCLLRTANPSNPKQAQRQRRLHMREIALHRLAGAGAHPGIVRLHRVIEPTLPAPDGSLTIPSPYTFLVMDFAPCGDLFTLILHRQVYLGRTALVAKVFAQLASAVSHCHALGIYHRDLKPENVLCWDGGATVRLADFGLATTERRSKEWRTGSVYHMSPECQNGNAQSPPYSPLANDIWSLAILLLNLLTARNPWARASPSDPTFSAYLTSPGNFLPQVLPISEALNRVLVKALDINWEVRESFGVEGLAQGVARVARSCHDSDESMGRALSFGKARQGMYASDVVFEGGMARCPWEVGMHIPSGSGSSDEQDNHHIRNREDLMIPRTPVTPISPSPARKRARNSSASFFAEPTGQSPTPSMIIEAQDIPPPTPSKEDVTVLDDSIDENTGTPELSVLPVSRWSVESASVRDDGEMSRRPSSYQFAPSAVSVRNSMENDTNDTNSAMSDIRFAHRSSSDSSSSGSSEGSSYSVSRTPAFQDEYASEPRVSDVDLADSEGIVYALAASPDSPVGPEFQPKTPYVDIYTQPSRRHRYRGRSRGRQPYPQRSSRDSGSRRGRFRKNKPDLKLNVDLPSFLPLHVHSNGSTTVGTHPRSRSRSPDHSVQDFRRRAREESLSSCPFAYSLSRSVHSANLGMDLDREQYRELYASPKDVQMISPSDINDYPPGTIHLSSGQVAEAESYHTSFDGSSLSRSVGSVDSPSGATEDSRENPIVLTASGNTQVSPTSTGVDTDGRKIVEIERSTLTTTVASPTDTRYRYSDDASRASHNGSDIIDYHFNNYRRSPSPSASSSRFGDRLPSRINSGSLDFVSREEAVSRRGMSYGSEGSIDWVGELRRAAGVTVAASDVGEGGQGEIDDIGDIPSFPGSYPGSRVASVHREVRPLSVRSRETRALSHGGASGLGLELYSNSRPSSRVRQQETKPVRESIASRVASGRYSVPPPSVRSRTDSADEALRVLHAIAVEANAWPAQQPADWQRPTSSFSSASTRPVQTFMAITTDTDPTTSFVDWNSGTNATTEDFREYAPYLQYAETGALASEEELRAQSAATSGRSSRHSFRTPTTTISTGQTSCSSAVQCGETSNTEASQRQNSGSDNRRSRSRTRSLLKFVSRRPFSSSGSGFVPFRASQTPPQAAMVSEPSFQFGKDNEASFSASFALEGGAHVSTTLNIDTNAKGNSPLIACLPSIPTTTASTTGTTTKRRRIDDADFAAFPTQRVPPKTSLPTKSRTWSFTRSRSQSRRRSRSLSPPPSRGTTRDVLFRLRSARNWFWYALSGMTSKSTASLASRSRKTGGSKWVSPKQQSIVTKPHLISIAA